MFSTLIILAAGITIGLEGPYWLSRLFSYVQNRQILKEIMPTDVKENILCKTPHAWINTTILKEKGVENIQICQVCGFIPSLNKMATAAGIDRIQENNAIRAIEDKILKDFMAREDADIKAYFNEEISKGVSFEKLTHIHGAGMTFGARFKEYKLSRSKEITKVLNRIDA